MITSLMTAAFVFAAPTAAGSSACKQASPALRGRAKITCAAAQRAALQGIGGKHLRLVSAELEEEKGRLVYSFDIARRGRAGVEEVQIDARSGELISTRHESAKDEDAEKD